MAANGDTANKIGTYQIAVLANYHGVPFYVAAPFTSIDMKILSGEHIVIEERPDDEMTHVGEHRIAAKGECQGTKENFVLRKCFRNRMLESGIRCDSRSFNSRDNYRKGGV